MTDNADKDLVGYGPFVKGVNNRLQDHELPDDRLRQGVNVRLSDAGLVKRRSGFSLYRAAVTKTHSLFSAGNYGLAFVDGSLLVLRDPSSGVESVLRSDMSPALPVAYVSPPNGRTYYSDGLVTGCLVDGQDEPWGIAPPSLALALTPITGALPPGRYQVALTYIDGQGEESGAGLVAQIVTTAGQGFRISNIAAPTTPGVQRIAIYVSPANGELLYLAAEVTLGTTSFDYITASATGRVLKTMHVTPPPAGTVLAYCGGRLYIADGPIVWYTEPLQYGRCRRASSFLMFPSDVSIMAGVKDGLWVAADQTYWLAGTDPAAFSPSVALPFGAAKGSLAKLPDDPGERWAWRSDRGLVRATTGGQIEELQSGELALDAASFGATLYMEEDGSGQLVSVNQPQGLGDVAAAQSYVDMEVRRSGKRPFPLESVVAAQSLIQFDIA